MASGLPTGKRAALAVWMSPRRMWFSLSAGRLERRRASSRRALPIWVPTSMVQKGSLMRTRIAGSSSLARSGGYWSIQTRAWASSLDSSKGRFWGFKVATRRKIADAAVDLAVTDPAVAAEMRMDSRSLESSGKAEAQRRMGWSPSQGMAPVSKGAALRISSLENPGGGRVSLWGVHSTIWVRWWSAAVADFCFSVSDAQEEMSFSIRESHWDGWQRQASRSDKGKVNAGGGSWLWGKSLSSDSAAPDSWNWL